MTSEHNWRVVIPTLDTGRGHVYLDDEELPVTGMNISIVAGVPVRITAAVIPRSLDVLLAFAEENPLVVEVHWPQCPHCNKFYNDPEDNPRWSIYNLAFRLLGNTKLWPAASRIIWE